MKDGKNSTIDKLRDGYKTAEGLGLGFNAAPIFLFRSYVSLKMMVLENFGLHPDFVDGGKFSRFLKYNRI
jgi:hypothetical protein